VRHVHLPLEEEEEEGSRVEYTHRSPHRKLTIERAKFVLMTFIDR
jgi:hypothetical protein